MSATPRFDYVVSKVPEGVRNMHLMERLESSCFMSGAGSLGSSTAIALGGVSSGLAFAVLMFVPDQSAKDVGLTGLAGLIAALTLMLGFLPASWLLLERRRTKKAAAARINLPGLPAVVQFSMNRPRVIIFTGIVFAVFGLSGIPLYGLESDFNKLISRDLSSVETARRIEDIFGVGVTPYIAPVESIGDDTVFIWTDSGRQRRLHRTGHTRKRSRQRHRGTGIGQRAKPWHR